MDAQITENLGNLAKVGIAELEDFVTAKEFTSQDLGKARVITSLISAYARLKQAEGAQQATTFMMARELANDKQELRAYIAATMPDHAVIKALKEPAAA